MRRGWWSARRTRARARNGRLFRGGSGSIGSIGLAFQPLCDAAPLIMVVAIIDYFQTGFGGVAYAFVFAVEVFFVGKNIGITVKYDRLKAMIYKAFHNSRRAWSTARMQQDASARRVNLQRMIFLSHDANLTIFRDCRKFFSAVPLHRWIEIIAI